jgi:hypothetical protein
LGLLTGIFSAEPLIGVLGTAAPLAGVLGRAGRAFGGVNRRRWDGGELRRGLLIANGEDGGFVSEGTRCCPESDLVPIEGVDGLRDGPAGFLLTGVLGLKGAQEVGGTEAGMYAFGNAGRNCGDAPIVMTGFAAGAEGLIPADFFPVAVRVFPMLSFDDGNGDCTGGGFCCAESVWSLLLVQFCMQNAEPKYTLPECRPIISC